MMRLEDWLAIVFVGALIFLIIVIGVVSLSGVDKPSDPVLVRDPINHNMMMLITKIPQRVDDPRSWEFKHCTPTNNKCGRLE